MPACMPARHWERHDRQWCRQLRHLRGVDPSAGLDPRTQYAEMRELWTRDLDATSGTIEAEVPSHGLAPFRVTPKR